MDMVVGRITHRGEDIDIITLNRWTSHGKEWAAKVVGLDPKYGLALSFCETVMRKWSRSGKNGATAVKLKGEGYYKVSNPESGRYGRECISYYYYDGNEMKKVDENEVYAHFKSLEVFTNKEQKAETISRKITL